MAQHVTVHGVAQAKVYAQKAKAALVDGIGEGFKKVSLHLEGEVKHSIAGRRAEKRSVDTGRFLNSVKGEHNGASARIATNLPYAPYLEHGTRKIAARGHFGNTLSRERQNIAKFVQQEVDARLG